jgi:hypothetical protein
LLLPPQTASDFTGAVVGESQKKTRAIIELAQGKVLFIDEAYVLQACIFSLFGRSRN